MATTLLHALAVNDQFISLASGAGVVVRDVLSCEQEQMRVLASLAGSSSVFRVLRGDNGTSAVAHAAGVGVDVYIETRAVPIALAPVPPIVLVEISGTSPSRTAQLQVKDGDETITVAQVTY